MVKKAKDKDLLQIKRAAIITSIIGVPLGLLALMMGSVGSFGVGDAGQAEVNAVIAAIGIGLPVSLWFTYRLIDESRNSGRRNKVREWLK